MCPIEQRDLHVNHGLQLRDYICPHLPTYTPLAVRISTPTPHPTNLCSTHTHTHTRQTAYFQHVSKYVCMYHEAQPPAYTTRHDPPIIVARGDNGYRYRYTHTHTTHGAPHVTVVTTAESTLKNTRLFVFDYLISTL